MPTTDTNRILQVASENILVQKGNRYFMRERGQWLLYCDIHMLIIFSNRMDYSSLTIQNHELKKISCKNIAYSGGFFKVLFMNNIFHKHIKKVILIVILFYDFALFKIFLTLLLKNRGTKKSRHGQLNVSGPTRKATATIPIISKTEFGTYPFFLRISTSYYKSIHNVDYICYNGVLRMFPTYLLMTLR